MARKPRLLDLFCGAGGAAVGYDRAGFEVVGVDLVRQYDYPFEFHLGNAMTFPLDGFDAVHASPPCQHFSPMDALAADRLFDPHPDLVAPVRDRLRSAGVPFIIENVPGAPLVDPIRLCGTGFGLEVVRHRLFELDGFTGRIGELVRQVPPCRGCRGAVRDGRAISVFGHGGGRLDGRRGMRGRFDDLSVLESFRRAMGIDHMTQVRGLSEAIPPAYTEWIGRHLITQLSSSPGQPHDPQAVTVLRPSM